MKFIKIAQKSTACSCTQISKLSEKCTPFVSIYSRHIVQHIVQSYDISIVRFCTRHIVQHAYRTTYRTIVRNFNRTMLYETYRTTYRTIVQHIVQSYDISIVQSYDVQQTYRPTSSAGVAGNATNFYHNS